MKLFLYQSIKSPLIAELSLRHTFVKLGLINRHSSTLLYLEKNQLQNQGMRGLLFCPAAKKRKILVSSMSIILNVYKKCSVMETENPYAIREIKGTRDRKDIQTAETARPKSRFSSSNAPTI